ncbi:MAG: PQQ-like beta-propeller repeat protein [Planctomycetota bacterium]|nr:PQQ-like beta-propeller repeat protein [Planctomycetota bacterium]MDA1177898.1 PQQ-like beta-propeller repeat protein [Planctomycetota bacterium]
MRRRSILLALCWISQVVWTNIALSDDWPQWMGEQRDSVWREEGIVKNIPEQGLPIKWRIPVAWGYSGPAVAEGKVYITDFIHREGDVTNGPGTRDELQGNERIQCFDAGTGKLIWKYEYDCPYKLSYPKGPRATPTVANGRVIMLGAEGRLTCLDANNGKVSWQHELKSEYSIESPIWGFSAHPLVKHNRVYAVVGGHGTIAVAWDLATGKEVWRALDAESPDPGYCPPTLMEHGGQEQLLIWHPSSLNSLNPANGETYWSIPVEPGYGMSITAPRKLQNQLYASAIGDTSLVMQLDDNHPGAEVLWRGKTKQAVNCANSTPFLENGMVYGSDCQTGALIGAKLADGERVWQTFEPTTRGERRASHGTAYIVKHEDKFFLFSELGDLILARLHPDRYEELGRFHVLEPTNECFGRDVVWSHPAFANRCLFARNDEELVCVDLSAP